MAFSPDRTTLYPLLEGVVDGDPENALRIYEFDVESSSFQGLVGYYPTEDGHPIGDFTPINESEFLVIERDGGQGETAEFKKIFKINIDNIDENGFVEKTEIADLLNIEDPNDLNGDGSTTFTFPFVTIEDVVVVDENTILVANDNNYPFSMGREGDIDNNEIILLELEEPLNLDPSLGGTVITPTLTEAPSFEPTFGNLEGDVTEVTGSNDLIFTGVEDDLIDTSLSGGNNRIYAGSGNDTVILGAKDYLSGAAGDDRFFVTSGGDNTITGGEGADQFWIAVAEIPESSNTITDFTSGEDVIGISLGIGFDDLSLTQDGDNTLISSNGSDLATLLNIDSTSLSADNFAFV